MLRRVVPAIVRAVPDEISFRSDVTVELVRSSASDSDVLFAARVSTQGEQTLETAQDADARHIPQQGPHQLPDARPSRVAVRAQLDDLLRAGAHLRVPRIHAAPHRVVQRRERALPRAQPGLLRARPRAQPGAGRQGRRLRLPARHARADRARGMRRCGHPARPRTRPTSGCWMPVSRARSPASCCRSRSTRRCT